MYFTFIGGVYFTVFHPFYTYQDFWFQNPSTFFGFILKSLSYKKRLIN